MAELWYYTSEGKQMDPVSMKELRRLVTDGVLKPTDMVWKEGMERWIRASSVKELYPDPIAALDHFFTGTKIAQPKGASAAPSSNTAVTSASGAANSSAKGTSAPGGSAAEDETPQTSSRKRRPSGSGDDDDAGDRAKAGKSGGMGIGILIVAILGAGVLFAALIVGVVIIVVVTRSGNQEAPPVAIVNPPDNKKDPNEKKGDDPQKKDPEKEQPLPADVKRNAGTLSVFLAPGNTHEFKLRVRGGQNATITVTNHTKTKLGGTIDFNITVVKENDDTVIVADLDPNINAQAAFTRPADETVRVRVVNAAKIGPRARCTISYNGG